MTAQTLHQLRELKLGGMANALEQLLVAMLMDPLSIHVMEPLYLRVNGATLQVNGAT